MRSLTIGGLALLGCAGIAFLAMATNLVTVGPCGGLEGFFCMVLAQLGFASGGLCLLLTASSLCLRAPQ